MPELDRAKFAYAVAAKLKELEIAGPREAERRFPSIRKPTWSRIGFSRTLSDSNFAAVCKVLDLDARDFVDLDARNHFNVRALADDRRMIAEARA